MNSSKEKRVETNPWSNFSKNLKSYKTPSLIRSLWQIANSFIPYVFLWILIIYSLSISLWITAFLIPLASAFMVRMFIIFHDCGHGSFFKSTKTNKAVGMFFGILAFTPYDKWHNQHLNHHVTVGNLDKRGIGDVWTMTKEEYKNSSKSDRFKYRLYRHPITMFGIGSIYVFLIKNRLTTKGMTQKEKVNIYFTNVILLLLFIGMGFAIGFLTFLIIQLVILYFAAIAGLWLFYLQHQYEDVQWFRNKEWNYATVALEGSSYVKFPKILQWFSGNIGFHHIHHLNAQIPNYNLEKVFRENKILQDVKPVTFIKSLKTLNLRIWDEIENKLVSYPKNRSVQY